MKRYILRALAVRANVKYGADLHVGPRSVVWAPRQLTIGNNVYIGKNCTIEVDGQIGDGTLIANMVGIIGRRDHDPQQIGVTVRASHWVGEHPDEMSHEVVIGSDVWIGYGATILSGVTVGDSCIIGAGSLVTSDIPPNSIAVGSPARIVRNRFSDADYAEHWARLEVSGVSKVAS